MSLFLIKQNKYNLAEVMGMITQTHTFKSLLHFLSNFLYPLLSIGRPYLCTKLIPSIIELLGWMSADACHIRCLTLLPQFADENRFSGCKKHCSGWLFSIRCDMH